MTIRLAKIAAFAVGGGTLVFQGALGATGNFNWRFLFADLILGALLVAAVFVADKMRAAILLLVGFSLAAGVFLVAASGALATGSYGAGPFAASVGLIPCAVFVVLLSRWLIRQIPEPKI
jgi:hypothetical protein